MLKLLRYNAFVQVMSVSNIACIISISFREFNFEDFGPILR